MKVYTKTGDDGTTALLGGRRVPKHDLRIEAYGTVDELNSHLGLLIDYINLSIPVDLLRSIQDRLFTLGATLATAPEKENVKRPDLHANDITALERAMDEMETHLPHLTNFVLPGGHIAVSQAHVCRCVCRRAERLASALQATEAVDQIVVQYLNRLSDYFFVLSRFLAMRAGVEEILWRPRG